MSKFFLAAICLCVLCFISCQFSENIHINQDGSGKMSFAFDAFEIMETAGDKLMANEESRMDSVMVFRDFLEKNKDSIAQLPKGNQKQLKALEPYKVHVVMDRQTKELTFDLSANFKSVAEVHNMFDAFNDTSEFQRKDQVKLNNPNNPLSVFISGGTTEIKYTFQKNTFARTAKVIDEKAHKIVIDSLGKMAMIFGAARYKLNYHFPRRVKYVSNQDALFSVDGKTLTLMYSFMKYLTDPKIFNLKVVLED
ncbi:MAG: hypothetical protein HRT67_09585 [Flavobacteriaceae bacterium]|nr:hypothetical protein [Flavobacteriaceae bacterium]